MSQLRFIHAADLHLDTPFRGLQEVNEAIAQRLSQATFTAFDHLIHRALREKVDFLLVAGDIYEQSERSLRAQLRFRDGLALLAQQGIPSYVVHGNHDPLDGWISRVEFPPEVTVFGSDRVTSVTYARDGVAVARIHGISYPTAKVSDDFGRGFQREGSEPFQIGLFHCNVGGDPNHAAYAPRSLKELEECRLDYWALGHVHERKVLSEWNPFVAYPGNLQGRHIREAGPRGALLVETEGSRVTDHRFLNLQDVRWEKVLIDIAGLESVDGLVERVQEELEARWEEAEGCSLVLRIHLTGRGPLHKELTRGLEALLERLRETPRPTERFLWVERLVDDSRPSLDWEGLAQAEDFVGSVLRLGEELREDPERLREWVKELWTHRRAGRVLTAPSEQELLGMLQEAVEAVAERLVEE